MPLIVRRPIPFCALLLLLWCGNAVWSAPATRSFDIPAGNAEAMLQRFAAQSGMEVLFSTQAAKGVRTNAVKGVYTVEDALQKMLSGTPLYLVNDTKNGVLRIARAPRPNAPRAAQGTTCDRPEENPIQLLHQHPKI